MKGVGGRGGDVKNEVRKRMEKEEDGGEVKR